MFLTLVCIVGAAAPLRAQFKVEFSKQVPGRLSSRQTPARISEDADDVLVAAGYARIGVLSMLRDRKSDSKASAQDRLCSEAAKHGGDVINGVVADRVRGDDLVKTKCVESEKYQVPEQRCDARGCRMVSVWYSRCIRTQDEVSTLFYTESSAVVWRNDPALAKWQLEQIRLAVAAEEKRDPVLALERRSREGDTAAIRMVVASHPSGGKVLDAAIDSGRIDLVRIFLAAGAKPEFNYHVVFNIKMLTMLLDHDAPSVQRYTGTTLLHAAAKWTTSNASMGPVGPAAKEQLAVMRLLLERGIPVDERDTQGQTPLMMAAYRGRLEAVRFLLDAGADPNARRDRISDYWGSKFYGDAKTVAGIAASGLQPDSVLPLLLSRGARPEYTDLNATGLKGQVRTVTERVYEFDQLTSQDAGTTWQPADSAKYIERTTYFYSPSGLVDSTMTWSDRYGALPGVKPSIIRRIYSFSNGRSTGSSLFDARGEKIGHESVVLIDPYRYSVKHYLETENVPVKEVTYSLDDRYRIAKIEYNVAVGIPKRHYSVERTYGGSNQLLLSETFHDFLRGPIQAGVRQGRDSSVTFFHQKLDVRQNPIETVELQSVNRLRMVVRTITYY